MSFRRLAKDTFIYGGADLIGKIMAFFTFPFIAAALSPKAFGALELITTSTALLSIVMNCGLNNSLQRYYWDTDTHERQRPVLVSSGLAAQILFGLAIFAVGMTAVPWALSEARAGQLPFGWIALMAALFLMIFSQWLQFALDIVRLHFAPWSFLTLTLLSRVLGIGLATVVVVFWKGGVDGLLSVQALVAAGVLPLALWMVRKDLTLNVDVRIAKKLVSFGYPFIFAGLAFWLFGSMDRWMLAKMSSIEETGIFSVSFKFASVVFFISTAFAQAWSPAAIKMRTDHPEIYRTMYANILLLLLFVMLVAGGGVALFAGEFISLFMPKSYAASALPLTILCFGVVIQATQQVTALGISLEKKTHIFARLAWVTAAINLVLNWLLIPSFGAVGAACATSFSHLVLTSSYLYFSQRLHPLPLPWRKLSLFMLLGTVIATVSIQFRATLFHWDVVLCKAVIACICLAIAWTVLPVKGLSYAKP